MTAKTVLHLDDESEIRALVALSLQRKGYTVHSAGSRREALQLLDAITPDIFICDYNLTESDGLEAIREFKRRLPQVPVILLTGVLIQPQLAEKTFGSLVDRYLEKASALGQLAAEVKRLTEGNK